MNTPTQFPPGTRVVVSDPAPEINGRAGIVQAEPGSSPERPVHVMLEGAPWSTDHAVADVRIAEVNE